MKKNIVKETGFPESRKATLNKQENNQFLTFNTHFCKYTHTH